MMRHEELVDFGADIIPFALKQGLKVQAYLHDGFWQDISTLSKFYEVSETASHQFSLISSSTWRPPGGSSATPRRARRNRNGFIGGCVANQTLVLSSGRRSGQRERNLATWLGV